MTRDELQRAFWIILGPISAYVTAERMDRLIAAAEVYARDYASPAQRRAELAACRPGPKRQLWGKA